MRVRILPITFFLVYALIVSAVGMPTANAAVGSRILYLGDSQSDSPFGHVVFEALSRHAAYVAGYAICASSPYSWLMPDGYNSRCGGWIRITGRSAITSDHGIHGPNLRELMEEHQPDTVVLQTGNNMYEMISGSGDSPGARSYFQRAKEVLMNGGRTKTCIWITPVYTTVYTLAQQQKLAELMTEVGGSECQVFRSLERTRGEFYPGGGSAPEHPNSAYATRWGQMVVEQMGL